MSIKNQNELEIVPDFATDIISIRGHRVAWKNMENARVKYMQAVLLAINESEQSCNICDEENSDG